MKTLITNVLGRSVNLLSFVAPKFAGKIGFELFCHPFRVPLKGFHHKFLETATRSSFKHGRDEIKVYRWKTGPKKILFLHGWQSHSFRWKNYVDCFPDGEYSLYALDAPAHGLSSGKFCSVPLYSEVIEKFVKQIDGVDAIVGHSVGAFSTLYTLFRLPLLPVQRLVLLAPPGDATEFISFYQNALKLSDRSMQLVRSHFAEYIGEPVEYFSATKFASTISRPGLIIHDRNDDETSCENSVAIHKVWNKSELRLTTGLSHNLKSGDVVSQVISFIRENTLDHASVK